MFTVLAWLCMASACKYYICQKAPAVSRDSLALVCTRKACCDLDLNFALQCPPGVIGWHTHSGSSSLDEELLSEQQTISTSQQILLEKQSTSVQGHSIVEVVLVLPCSRARSCIRAGRSLVSRQIDLDWKLVFRTGAIEATCFGLSLDDTPHNRRTASPPYSQAEPVACRRARTPEDGRAELGKVQGVSAVALLAPLRICG